MNRFLLPLGVFVLMVGLLGYGLSQDVKKLPSINLHLKLTNPDWSLMT